VAIDATAFAGPLGSGMLEDHRVKLDPSLSGLALKMGNKFDVHKKTPFSHSESLPLLFFSPLLSSPPLSLRVLGCVDQDANESTVRVAV